MTAGRTADSARRSSAALARAAAVASLLALAAAPRAACAVQEQDRAAPSTPFLVLGRIGAEPSADTGFGVIGLPGDVLAAAAALSWTREDWSEVWSVHVESETNAPLLGAHRVAGEVLWLVPAFPPAPGVRYRAVFRPAALARRLAAAPGALDAVAAGSTAAADRLQRNLAAMARAEAIVADLSLGAPPARAPTAVAAVHPSTREVPENLLRLYVHFTGPMRRGGVYRWIRLEDAAGSTVERAFLELGEELWDRDARRLTLLLDPGRIKTGLAPREEEGPALAAGHDVALVIDGSWPDASGRALAATWRQGFVVGPADREPPDPARWRLLAPPLTGSRDPLRVAFDEPLDFALVQRWVWVEDGDGRLIEGSIAIGEGESSWSFTPDASWRTGPHALRVDRRLEDLAGNRVGRPFEVDLARSPASERTKKRGEAEGEGPASLPFTIAP